MENKLNQSSIALKNKRIAKNTLLLYFRMIITLLISLYTSRVVLNSIGIEDYGIYNVVGGVVAMFGFFSSAMSSATQRFLSYEIGKGNFVQLRKTFNAILVIHIGIAFFILIIAESIGYWFVKAYLVIPPERIGAALWIYHFSVLSFIIIIMQVPYNAIIIAHEKMNVYAYISILEVSLKLLIVLMLNWISFDKLKLYGLLHFTVVLIITIIYFLYSRVNFKESHFQSVKDKQTYKTLVNYSGWNLFVALSNMAYTQGINILLNIFFGPIANAARGLANQVKSAVNSFVTNFQLAFSPQIFKSYAEGEKEYLISLIFNSARFSFYLLIIISLPIVLEIDQILKIWLKIVPEYTSIFTVLTLIHIILSPMSFPIMKAVQATGLIKKFQIITGTLMISIFPITYVFYKLNYPAESTYVIAIIIELVALFTRLNIAGKLLKFPVLDYIVKVVCKNLLILLISISMPLIIRNLMVDSLLRLLIIILTSLIWSIIVIYVIGVNKSEKKYIINGINNIIKQL